MSHAVSASEAVRVRRASRGDLDALMAFYREHHSHRSRLTNPELWRWSFARQPHAQDGFPFFVLESNGKIVGGIGCIRAKLSIDGECADAAFPVNYFIDPAYKGLPALRLLRTVLNESPVVIGSYVSPDAMKLLLKSGFADLSAELRTYYYGVRLGSYSLRSVVLWAARRAAEGSRQLRRITARDRHSYRVATEMDAAFVGALEVASSPAGSLSIRKDAAWLQWRYADSPLLRPQFVYQFNAGRPAALAIISVDADRREMVLLDCVVGAPPAESAIGLLDRLIALARSNGCRTLVTHALSDRLSESLRACWFASTNSQLGLVVYARDKSMLQCLSDARRWHFMLGDTDAY